MNTTSSPRHVFCSVAARILRGFACAIAALVALTALAPRAHAAQHFWAIDEVYSNNDGTLQFVEFFTTFSGQHVLNTFSIDSTNIPETLTHTYTFTANLPSSATNNKHFLIGTAGIHAAGGPTPDYIIPNGYLFTAGGSLDFFGTNSGPYTALPTDGLHSRNWAGGDITNSPINFAGQTGTVTPAPEPSSLALLASGAGLFYVFLRRRAA